MCGQSIAYNIYATLGHTNPLFMGFLGYQNVNKEEIDFLTSVKDKICPLEVKSGNYRTHKSLDAFCNKFSNRIGSKYVVHTKDYKWENGIYYIPMYMVPFL